MLKDTLKISKNIDVIILFIADLHIAWDCFTNTAVI